MSVVLNAEPLNYSSNAVNYWEAEGYEYRAASWDELLKEKNEGVKVLIVRLAKFINRDIIELFPDLEFIISATTGHDHIDINILKEKGVKLVSLRGSNEFLKTIPSTAEHTWAILMSLVRHIPQSYNHVMNGGWNRDLFRGNQLAGKIFGIVGLGRTGTKVAHYARAFGMSVCYYDPYQNSTELQKYTSLKALVRNSDFISLHIHLDKETTNLISSDIIEHFKHGSFLINTSRGKIVDEQAIISALSSGTLKGYGTDVVATELTNLDASPLISAMNDGLNVLVTPHIGGATIEAMHSCEEFIVKKFFVSKF